MSWRQRCIARAARALPPGGVEMLWGSSKDATRRFFFFCMSVALEGKAGLFFCCVSVGLMRKAGLVLVAFWLALKEKTGRFQIHFGCP